MNIYACVYIYIYVRVKYMNQYHCMQTGVCMHFRHSQHVYSTGATHTNNATCASASLEIPARFPLPPPPVTQRWREKSLRTAPQRPFPAVRSRGGGGGGGAARLGGGGGGGGGVWPLVVTVEAANDPATVLTPFTSQKPKLQMTCQEPLQCPSHPSEISNSSLGMSVTFVPIAAVQG